MRKRKYYLQLTNTEHRLILQCLIDYRNKLISQGKYTDGVDELISRRYTNYLKPIIEYELQEGQKYYNFYSDLIRENAGIWYEEIDDINDLLDKNFQWTFDYFSLRSEFYDTLYYKE